ncbi:MAG: AAA family ATPase [Patescibacteria group bacterium]|nr:AAA family ATPase [Patescibacteria group bacterium]
MNNFIYILKLSQNQKKIFKILAPTIKYLIIFISLGLFFSGKKYLSLIGFWLFYIFLIDLLLLKYFAPRNLLFENNYLPEDYLDNTLKFIILNSLLEIKHLDKLDLSLIKHLLGLKEIKEIFLNLDINPQEIKRELNELLEEIDNNKKIDFKYNNFQIILKNLKPILINSLKLAKNFNFMKINSSIFFISILERNNPLIEILMNRFKISFLDIYTAFLFVFFKKREEVKKIDFSLLPWFYYPDYYLINNKKEHSLNLLVYQKRIGWLIGYQKEKEQILKQNFPLRLILIGPKGIGKKTLIAHLAYLIEKREIAGFYSQKKIFQINLDQMTSEDELKNIFWKIINTNSIVFLPDIQKNFKYFPLIEYFLKITPLNIIISLDDQSFKLNLKIYNLEKKFKILKLGRLSEMEVLTIIFSELKNNYLHPRALTRLVELVRDYFGRKENLLLKSREVLNYSFIFLKKNNLKILTEEIIGDAFSQYIEKNDKLKKFYSKRDFLIKKSFQDIHQNFVNQNLALKTILNNFYKKNKIKCFLFLGSPGVGKKTLAKILAQTYFDNNFSYFNLENLIISGEIDYFKSKIISFLSQNQKQLILIDKVEKATPDLILFLISLFSENKIENNYGNRIGLNNNFFIFVTTLFSEFIDSQILEGKKWQNVKISIKNKLLTVWPKNFVNSFSDIIIFRNLNQREKEKALDILIREINFKIAPKDNFQIKISHELKKYLTSLNLEEVKFLIFDRIIPQAQKIKKDILLDYHNNEIVFLYQ